MRLKLLIIASMLAGLLGAVLCLLVVFSFASTLLALIVLAATTIVACIFVYRHTARRRALQALLTALGATLISLLIVYAVYRYSYAGLREQIVRRIPFVQSLR